MTKPTQYIMHYSSNLTSFFFIRHGQTNFNKERKYAGHIDISLNKQGVEQVENLISLFKNQNISIIYTSPLRRAVQTANIIAAHLNIPVIVADGLEERNFGSFQGKNKPSYNKRLFPDGQTLYCYNKQVLRGMKKLKNLNHSLVIAHSGTYKCLSKYLLLPPLGSITNATLVNFKLSTAKTWEVLQIDIQNGQALYHPTQTPLPKNKG